MITTKIDLSKYLQTSEIQHSERVSAISEMIAIALNLEIDEIEKITELAYIHDIVLFI